MVACARPECQLERKGKLVFGLTKLMALGVFTSVPTRQSIARVRRRVSSLIQYATAAVCRGHTEKIPLVIAGPNREIALNVFVFSFLSGNIHTLESQIAFTASDMNHRCFVYARVL